jgi:hypothetical protein
VRCGIAVDHSLERTVRDRPLTANSQSGTTEITLVPALADAPRGHDFKEMVRWTVANALLNR